MHININLKLFLANLKLLSFSQDDNVHVFKFKTCTLSLSQETYSLETRTELAVLRTYVENQAILEPILLYRASKCKQTKEQGSEDCL